MSELKEYYFTDEQIDFILDVVRDCSLLDIHENCRGWVEDLANQIEDQIVYHPSNS